MEVNLTEATQLLSSGHVVAVPTETVYGLAAALDCPKAIDQIFRLKNRPPNNPLIIHIAELDQLVEFTPTMPAGISDLARAFWPGPLTLVLPVDVDLVPTQVRAGLVTAAFRVPNHPLALELLRNTGPLVMPSANLSGKPSSTSRLHVETDFGGSFPVLDGGVCRSGIESTILHREKDLWSIIRLGALSAESFLPILGYVPQVVGHDAEKAPICPGQLFRHYAPRAKLILCESNEQCKGPVIIGFSDRTYFPGASVLSLGLSTSPESAAGNLYAVLRKLDQEGIDEAWVDMSFPREGLWMTILERLQKASH